MASKGGVINAALNHLGESESLTPTTSEDTWVVRIRNRYDEKCRLLFEKHPWNFCTTTVQLTASEPTPDGWAYGFLKPAKCWRIVRVGGDAANMDSAYATIPYEDRGGRILTNSDTTWLKYIDGDWLTQEGSWPQVFADALSAELASAVAPVTNGDENRLDRIKGETIRTMRAAKNWDAQQNPRLPDPPSRWQVGRMTSRYSNGRRENG